MSNMVINDLLVLDEMTESELSRVLGGILSSSGMYSKKRGGLPILNTNWKPTIIQSPSGYDFGEQCVDDSSVACPYE